MIIGNKDKIYDLIKQKFLADPDFVKEVCTISEDTLIKETDSIVSKVHQLLLSDENARTSIIETLNLMPFIEKKMEELKQEQHKKRLESEEPYVEIVSQTVSAENGIELRLDWNAAFIKYLKGHGYKGETDSDIVDSWIATLNQDRFFQKDDNKFT